LKTVLEVLEATKEYFQKQELESARFFAEEVLSAALNIKRFELYLEHDRPLTEGELERCRQFVRRKAKREPVPYMTGYVDFYNCQIEISQDALIPRQETELFVDKIAQDLKKRDLKGKSLWDVCTGSGCIGIALKKQFPELAVFLSDISPQALALARRNCQKNGVEAAILEGDLLTPFEGQKCHFFVCNPPYVANEQLDDLEPEVRDWEPKLALMGGPQGLDFYRRLTQELPSYLYPNAKIWLEIGADQGALVKTLFKDGNVARDYAGKDRFFSLEIE
jgi:release factor glutamine methyltransferase